MSVRPGGWSRTPVNSSGTKWYEGGHPGSRRRPKGPTSPSGDSTTAMLSTYLTLMNVDSVLGARSFQHTEPRGQRKSGRRRHIHPYGRIAYDMLDLLVTVPQFDSTTDSIPPSPRPPAYLPDSPGSEDWSTPCQLI